MNNLRKSMSLPLVFVLLLGLLSGCGGEEPMAENSGEPAAEEVVEESGPTVAAPTPAVFFGVEADPVIAQWDEFVFDKDPAQAAAAYVDLLQNAFGFTVTDQSADERSNKWALQYGDSAEASISVSSVFTEAEKYVVTVIYSQSIRWQDGAAYDWSEQTAEDACAPDPEFYFNTAAAEKDGNSMTLVLSGAPGVVVYEYLSVLKNIYDLTEVDFYTEAETWQWRLQKGGDKNAAVSIGLDKRGDGNWDLSFIFGENVTLVQAETQSGAGKGEISVSELEPVVNGPALPDPAAFLGGIAPDEDEPADNSGWHVYYKTQIDDGWTAAHEYVELLQDSRFGFVLTECLDNTTLYLKSEYYFFDYTGAEAITPASDRYYLKDYHDFSSDVFVWIQKNGQREYTGISIYYSGDLQVADFGDRASTIPDRVSGGSGSGSSSSRETFTPEFAKQDCLKCRGDGDCNTCGGYGEVRKYAGAGETVRAKCSTCRGSGNCTACGGSGKR